MKRTIKMGIAACMLLALSCTKEPLIGPQITNTQTNDNSTTAHFIGEHFGGGIVFWVDSLGEHGLIADETDLGLFIWWGGEFPITGAIKRAIGAGNANTKKIIRLQGKTGSYAALECAKSARGGYSDWFLPSINELSKLYQRRSIIGGFDGDFYWSSTEIAGESSNYAAWVVYFPDGSIAGNYKYNAFSVRAIRSF
ncbi:MAG TPA: DUF1566 domain-containing protein [Panacibacter sp.]|nr:DUF1566 domain-containing protein [Panacibacter sp.]